LLSGFLSPADFCTARRAWFEHGGVSAKTEPIISPCIYLRADSRDEGIDQSRRVSAAREKMCRFG
jgi:hypothetical protein